jgi:hypothetical protein
MIDTKKSSWPPSGYPSLQLVEQGCDIIAAAKPGNVFLTVSGKLHNLGLRKTTAHLQVFDIATKAAQWMLRDIHRHDPLRLFAPYRKRNSTSYNTDRIADAIDRRYREIIRSRFTLNSSVFTGLCSHLAADISGWMQKMAEAEKKGLFERYRVCAEFIVPFGKYRDTPLKALPRDAVFGFAFLQPTKAQYERLLQYLDALLDDLPEEASLREEAETYRLPWGRRKGHALGSMRPQTWRRLRLIMQRDLDRMDQIEAVRKVAQDFLRFTPPRFPEKQSGVLSQARRNDLQEKYLEALQEYGALPPANPEAETEGVLTVNERRLFQKLQQQAYAATNQPRYITLQWDRADGAVKSRDVALLFDPYSRQYLFLAHILHSESRHRRPMVVRDELIDVNNPDFVFSGRKNPSIASLYELEFSAHQRELLDRARKEAHLWKDKGQCSGAVRAAKLQAHYDRLDDAWWFEVMLSVGLRPQRCIRPERIVGVHIDPRQGWFVGVFSLDGTALETFQLDELRVAQLLVNQCPEEQARLKPGQRTAKERSHRYADAIVALCRHYQAACAIENVSYRSTEPGPQQLKPQQDNSRTVFTHLQYKLPLVELFEPVDVRGVAPRRDCGACGQRQAQALVKSTLFQCAQCGHREAVSANAAREVARRGLWILSKKKPPRPKIPKDKQTGVL